MLIIPLVENVFKHGIERRGLSNLLRLSLTKQGKRLNVEVYNRIAHLSLPDTGGSGLNNLLSRLKILYGENFQFDKTEKHNYFIVRLSIRDCPTKCVNRKCGVQLCSL